MFRRPAELPLMGLAWLLIHRLEDDSPMLGAWRDAAEFRLTVTVHGLDTLLATEAIGGKSYGRDDLLLDHEFEDAVDQLEGTFRLDLRKLGAVRSIAG